MIAVKFSGIQKTSLIDYPDRVASVLFTPGCNLRCPYCHNWRIVADPKPPFLNEETALQLLENRKKYVDSVVVSGGEPTMHKELPKFLKKLKDRGFSVKLDTNGFFPDVLEECLPHVDYVALDIKTSLEKYSKLGAKDTRGFLNALAILKTGKVKYEFRTTVVPGFVDAADIDGIIELAEGSTTLALQQFVPGDTLDYHYNGIKPYAKEEITKYREIIERRVAHTLLRI